MFKLYIIHCIILIASVTPAEKPQLFYMGASRCPLFDNYFNRIFMLQYRGMTVASAVFIEPDRAITSFNPFRNLSKNKTSKNDIFAVIYKTKVFKVKIRKTHYEMDHVQRIKCGRQIIPMKETSMRADQWHGADQKHSPVHDLMVFRLSERNTFITQGDQYHWKDPTYRKIGPMKAELAGQNDELGAQVKIGALGIGKPPVVWSWEEVCSVEYNTADVLLDCDEWLPHNWGHFICLNNQDGWLALRSAAFLVSDDKVFGVGSFLITKGKRGILAFTDVRPYKALINKTCTKDDQELKEPPTA